MPHRHMQTRYNNLITSELKKKQENYNGFVHLLWRVFVKRNIRHSIPNRSNANFKER